MSYPVAKKKYLKRKRPGVKPSRWSVYGAAGAQLAKDVLYLKSIINSEPHNFYVQSANNFSWNGIVVGLSGVTVGDTDNDRTGNRVLPRFLNINMHISSGEGNQVVRVILFRYWGEDSGAVPNVFPADVLRDVGTQYSPLSHLNDSNTGQKGDRARRIEVLRSVFLNLDQIEMRAATLSWDVEVNGMNVQRKEHCEWSDNVLAVQPISGGFYVMFIANSAVNAAYQLESKMVFYDN